MSRSTPQGSPFSGSIPVGTKIMGQLGRSTPQGSPFSGSKKFYLCHQE